VDLAERVDMVLPVVAPRVPVLVAVQPNDEIRRHCHAVTITDAGSDV